MKSFKINKKFEEAWTLFRKNMPMLFLFMACTFFIKILSMKGGALASLFIFVIGLYVAYVINIFLLSLIEGKVFNLFSESLLPSRKFLNFSISYILINLIILITSVIVFVVTFYYSIFHIHFLPWNIWFMIIGVIVLICGGSYLLIRVSFSPLISIEYNLNALKSINKSWKITKKNFWFIFSKLISVAIVLCLGVIIPSVIGIFINIPSYVFLGLVIILSFISIPMGMILFVYLYKSILDKHKERSTDEGINHSKDKEIKAEKVIEGTESIENKPERLIKDAEIIEE